MPSSVPWTVGEASQTGISMPEHYRIGYSAQLTRRMACDTIALPVALYLKPVTRKAVMSHPSLLTPESLRDADTVARLLDHALLNPTLTDAQMAEELKSLRPYPLASVCIKPYAVPQAREVLAGTPIGIGTVIGFPHGSPLPAVKAFETERAFADGAGEVDMVVNVGKVLSEDWAFVYDDIRAVLDVARAHNGLLKVIFETDFLPEDSSKIKLCEICTELGVDFVKTSTGFGFVKGADGRFGYVGATSMT